MMRHPRTGEILLTFDLQIERAAAEGENDLAMNLSKDQSDWYEFFGYGDDDERAEYWRRKEDGRRRYEERFPK